jgi:hypothetical protein
MQLGHELEIHHRLSGRDGAVAMARQRSGGELDPTLVAALDGLPKGGGTTADSRAESVTRELRAPSASSE